jgi:hypothetical protein
MATKRQNPAVKLAQLAKIEEKAKAKREEIKADEQKRLAALGAVVADLLKNDAEVKAVLVSKLQAITAPRLRAEIAYFLTS